MASMNYTERNPKIMDHSVDNQNYLRTRGQTLFLNDNQVYCTRNVK